jgi:hypothetical protein
VLISIHERKLDAVAKRCRGSQIMVYDDLRILAPMKQASRGRLTTRTGDLVDRDLASFPGATGDGSPEKERRRR